MSADSVGGLYGPKGDWWSVGIVMFEMLMRNRPIIVPSETDEGLRFSSNLSNNATLILQGVSIIFLTFILTMPKWWGQGEYGGVARGSLSCWEVTLTAP